MILNNHQLPYSRYYALPSLLQTPNIEPSYKTQKTRDRLLSSLIYSMFELLNCNPSWHRPCLNGKWLLSPHCVFDLVESYANLRTTHSCFRTISYKWYPWTLHKHLECLPFLGGIEIWDSHYYLWINRDSYLKIRTCTKSFSFNVLYVELKMTPSVVLSSW
jgi:hypothetical protein